MKIAPAKMTPEALAKVHLDLDMGNDSVWSKAFETTVALLAHIAALEQELAPPATEK